MKQLPKPKILLTMPLKKDLKNLQLALKDLEVSQLIGLVNYLKNLKLLILIC
jgi:hypothetical protein